MKIKFFIIIFCVINGLNANPVPVDGYPTSNNDRNRSNSSTSTPDTSNRPLGWWASHHETQTHQPQSKPSTPRCHCGRKN